MDLYNHGVRHLTGTRPLPPGTMQGKFACSIGSVWLAGTGYAFLTGSMTAGYVLGGVMAVIATLVATTNVCIPSLIYTAIFGRKMICVAQST